MDFHQELDDSAMSIRADGVIVIRFRVKGVMDAEMHIAPEKIAPMLRMIGWTIEPPIQKEQKP